MGVSSVVWATLNMVVMAVMCVHCVSARAPQGWSGWAPPREANDPSGPRAAACAAAALLGCQLAGAAQPSGATSAPALLPLCVAQPCMAAPRQCRGALPALSRPLCCLSRRRHGGACRWPRAARAGGPCVGVPPPVHHRHQDRLPYVVPRGRRCVHPALQVSRVALPASCDTPPTRCCQRGQPQHRLRGVLARAHNTAPARSPCCVEALSKRLLLLSFFSAYPQLAPASSPHNPTHPSPMRLRSAHRTRNGVGALACRAPHAGTLACTHLCAFGVPRCRRKKDAATTQAALGFKICGMQVGAGLPCLRSSPRGGSWRPADGK